VQSIVKHQTKPVCRDHWKTRLAPFQEKLDILQQVSISKQLSMLGNFFFTPFIDKCNYTSSTYSSQPFVRKFYRHHSLCAFHKMMLWAIQKMMLWAKANHFTASQHSSAS
jgi:hypothetical protein